MYTFAAMSKRLITSVLILLFLGRVIGYFPIFKIEQWTIRREIKTRLKSAIPNSDLEVFSYPIGSRDATKYGSKHEFEIDGEMYDVVRRENEGSILKLYCFHDRKETDLFKKLDQIVNDRMNSTNHPFRNVVNIFGKTFHSIVPVTDMLKLHSNSVLDFHLFSYSNTYFFEFIQKFAPPPRFLI